MLSSASTGAGDAPVAPCDSDGFTPSYTTSHGNVTAVTVGGVADPACEGGTIEATVTNAAGSSIATAGPQVIPADADNVPDSVTLTTNVQPAASQVAGTQILVEGP